LTKSDPRFLECEPWEFEYEFMMNWYHSLWKQGKALPDEFYLEDDETKKMLEKWKMETEIVKVDTSKQTEEKEEWEEVDFGRRTDDQSKT